MTKFKKIIIVIVSLSLLVLSMVLPSFAYTIDDDGTIDIDTVQIEAYGSYYPTNEGSIAVFNFEAVDLVELITLNGNWFFFDMSIEAFDSNDNMVIPSVLLAFGNVSSAKSFEFNDTRLGGNVKLKYTVTNTEINGIQIQCTEESRYYQQYVRKLRLTIQIYPHLSTINEILKNIPDSDMASLLIRIDELERAYDNLSNSFDNLSLAYQQLSSENVGLSKDNEDLRLYNKELLDKRDELFALVEEQENIIVSLREGFENNNAIFSLFNGIGNGIYGFVSPLLSLSIGGISIGAMLAFVCALVLVYFLVKLVINAVSKG